MGGWSLKRESVKVLCHEFGGMSLIPNDLIRYLQGLSYVQEEAQIVERSRRTGHHIAGQL